jgi:hypothetical protein
MLPNLGLFLQMEQSGAYSGIRILILRGFRDFVGQTVLAVRHGYRAEICPEIFLKMTHY